MKNETRVHFDQAECGLGRDKRTARAGIYTQSHTLCDGSRNRVFLGILAENLLAYKREAKAPNSSICVLLRPCFAHCHFAPVKRGDRASPCGRASRPVSSGQVAATRISECARTKTEPGSSLTPPPPLPRHRGHLLVAFLTASINPRGTGPRGHPVSEKVIQTRATATGRLARPSLGETCSPRSVPF